MNYREKMKEYLKEPDEHSSQWGRWGILNKEQRDLIKRLLREMDSADVVIKNQFEENEKLKELCNKYEEEHNTTFEEWKKTIAIIDELEKYINHKIKQCYDEGSTVGEFSKICDIDEKLKELKGVDKE